MPKRDIYIDNLPLDQAQARFYQRIKECPVFNAVEEVAPQDALGRVSAAPVFAELSNPHYNASAMDGIAVKARDTFGATEKQGVMLELDQSFVYVNTGEIIPEPFDAVIMIEDVEEVQPNQVLIRKSAVPWQHIRPVGEDMAAGELIIPSNHQISPVDIGAILAGGVRSLQVYKRPRVAILPTGSELVEVGTLPKKGQIVEFNSWVFRGLVEQWGGIPKRYPVTKDDFSLLKQQLAKAAAENDVILVCAGSSAGTKDFTADVIRELGEVIVHGIATKPGKPAILGVIQAKPVVGLPGYPVSAFFVMDFFVKPLLADLTRIRPQKPVTVSAVTSKKIVSSLKHEEFIRAKLGEVDGKMIVSPLNRGAGVIMSLVRADGYLRVPRNSEGYQMGDAVDVTLFRDTEQIQNTIVGIGSHDPMLDILAELLQTSGSGVFLSSSHVGSMGGIMALRRGECHVAGIHLLDATDGSYNASFIRRYLPGEEIALVHIANRSQGLMVKRGNPREIHSFADLARSEISFINRQKGSGTRMLLDYHLTRLNIDPASINGYTREQFTHLTTASAVSEGSADVSLGIYWAAQALGLDFIPIASEQYDLAIPVKFLHLKRLQSLLEVIRSDQFKQELEAMGGYDTSRLGEVEIVS